MSLRIGNQLLVAGFVSLAPFAARAEMVVQDLPVTPGLVIDDALAENGTTQVNDTLTWMVDGFDPALGTLDSVTVAGLFDFAATLVLGPSGGGGGASSATEFFIDGVSFNGGGNGTGGGGAPGATVPLPFSFGPAGAPIASDHAAYASFLSAGQVAITAEMLYSASPTGTGSTIDIELLATSGLTITYDYTPLVVGDTDGDGDIDDFDLLNAISNFTGSLAAGAGGKGVPDGDTDADQDVDDFDLLTMISGFTGSLSVPAVPEPASLGLLALGGLLVMRRRHD